MGLTSEQRKRYVRLSTAEVRGCSTTPRSRLNGYGPVTGSPFPFVKYPLLSQGGTRDGWSDVIPWSDATLTTGRRETRDAVAVWSSTALRAGDSSRTRSQRVRAKSRTEPGEQASIAFTSGASDACESRDGSELADRSKTVGARWSL